MDEFFGVLSAILQFFQIPITIYGFTFTFWNLFLFVMVGTVLMWFLGALLNR